MPEAQPLLPLPLGFRANREITDILGAGGYMEITRRDDEYGAEETEHETHKLEVNRWIIRPKYHNVEVPCSGSYGAVEKRRLATDFKFVAHLAWDAKGWSKVGSIGPSGRATKVSPFFDDRVDGFETDHFQVGVLFAMGEQGQYHRIFPGELNEDERGYFYYCSHVQLDDLTVINSAMGDDVIRGIVRGSGSAPLRRYYGTTWLAAGGFHLTQAAQEQSDEVP